MSITSASSLCSYYSAAHHLCSLKPVTVHFFMHPLTHYVSICIPNLCPASWYRSHCVSLVSSLAYNSLWTTLLVSQYSCLLSTSPWLFFTNSKPRLLLCRLQRKKLVMRSNTFLAAPLTASAVLYQSSGDSSLPLIAQLKSSPDQHSFFVSFHHLIQAFCLSSLPLLDFQTHPTN